MLTNKRLWLKPKGEDGASWLLQDITKVIRFNNIPGFAIIEDDGARYEFRNTGKRSRLVRKGPGCRQWSRCETVADAEASGITAISNGR